MSEPTVEDLLIAWREWTLRHDNFHFRTAEEIMMRDCADRLIAERKAREPKVMSAEEVLGVYVAHPGARLPSMEAVRTALLASVAVTFKQRLSDWVLPVTSVDRARLENFIDRICEVSP
jgi:hypothetical protein